jgi:tRNA (mo5U34)-methyltransferase
VNHPTVAEAEAFIANSTFLWHQRFELVPGVVAPGVNDINWLLDQSHFPSDMTGMSVLDIGTTNGAIAFDFERRGATRVVAVDIMGPDHFGFGEISRFLDSKVEFVQASVYELADVLNETFDIVVFWGVLYHLRHPLLGLDSVRRLAKGQVSIETAVCDASDGNVGPLIRFHRLDDLGKDPSNWFSPSVEALEAWVASAGFAIRQTVRMPLGHPAQRALLDMRVVAGQPEYVQVSYERPLLLKQIDLT